MSAGQAAELSLQDRLVGTTIDGRYLVESVLGEGGMGLVYRAKHAVLNKPLALKVLRPDVSRDQEIMSRFKQEAQSASAIGNQHIIDISDFGVLPDGATYFVMEFLDGQDLTSAIESSKPGVSAERTVHIAIQLCHALGAAHQIGIVHRDLKPDNIFLIRRNGESDFVKVLDFGIAKVGGTASKLTRAGQVFGTPHYMSPEQCAGTGVDARTDVYALGIIMYEMLTGITPFDADNLMGILTKHLYEEPVPPRQRNPLVPEALEAVVMRAIVKDKERRYGSMDELRADLEALHSGGSVARATLQSMETTLPGQGTKAGLWIGLAALVALGAGGVFWMTREDAPQQIEVRNERPVVRPNPPIAQQQPQVGAATTVVAAPVLVRIVSEPSAELWRGEEMLGRTPHEIPRPTGDDRLELELREPGFEPLPVVISELTATEIVRPLTPARRRRADSPTSAMESPAMAPSMEGGMRQSEVLDPWEE